MGRDRESGDTGATCEPVKLALGSGKTKGGDSVVAPFFLYTGHNSGLEGLKSPVEGRSDGVLEWCVMREKSCRGLYLDLSLGRSC